MWAIGAKWDKKKAHFGMAMENNIVDVKVGDIVIARIIKLREAMLSRTPVRQGDVYCSPVCGGGEKHGCTWENYLEAKLKAEKLARQLGKMKLGSWKPVVHENLGWHYKAVNLIKRLCVAPALVGYTCTLGESNAASRWLGKGDTPELAVKDAIRKGRMELLNIESILRPFEKIKV